MTTNAPDANLEAARRIAHVSMLGSLREKTSVADAAPIVIDAQNEFCADGGLVRGGAPLPVSWSGAHP